MTNSRTLVNEIKNLIDGFQLDDESHKNMISSLSKINKHFELLDFQVSRLTTDKSIIHNLLTKTSSELTSSLEISEKKSKEITSILNSTPAMIYVKDKDSNFEIVNNELRNNFKLVSDSSQINDYLYGHTLFNDLKIYETKAVLGKFNIDKLMLNYTDKHYRVNLSPLIDDDNEVIGIVGVIWDISELKSHEKQLEIKVNEAEKANKAKDQFLANISHEIRTPMNAIMGLSEILLKKEMDSESYNYTQNIYSSANNLLHIINDILDFSKLESGKFTIENEDFLLEDVIESVVINCESKLINKDIEIIIDVDKELKFELYGGYYRIIQVLTNLLSNAIKFTDKGKIEIVIELARILDDKIDIRFKVIDTGIGMSQEQLSSLFKPFSQVDYSNTRKYGGTGLGLAISKQLINEMGGEISCYSEPMLGSSFIFNLVLSPSIKVDSIVQDYSALSNSKSILLLSNSSEITRNIKNIFSFFNFQIDIKNRIDDIDSLERYSSVILDSNFDLDSFESNPVFQQTTPNICLLYNLNYDLSNPKIKVKNHIKKPFTFLKAFQILNDLSDNNVNVLNSSDEELNYNFLKHVLIVDDNEINIEIAINLLQDVNINYMTATDGKEAVDLYNTYYNKLDLIMMDLHMPVMDGYEATQIIRKSNRNIPIIALTADAIIGIKDKTLSFGFNDILTKPYTKSDFEKILDKWIHFKQNGEVLNEVNSYNSEILDTTNILELLNNNYIRYNEFLKKYLTNHKNIEDELELLIHTDRKEFNSILHKLKSSAGTIGAYKVYKSIREIENSCNNETAFLDSYKGFKSNNQELLDYLETMS